jgi:hypothetical protein
MVTIFLKRTFCWLSAGCLLLQCRVAVAQNQTKRLEDNAGLRSAVVGYVLGTANITETYGG